MRVLIVIPVLYTEIDVVPFEWIFEMKAMDKTAIRDHLMLPLLFTLTEKTAREQALVDVIKTKDRLIDDFTKTQGIKTTLSNLD